MTKSLGQKLFEAKEKYYKKKNLFHSVKPWKSLTVEEQKAWKKHGKTVLGSYDMQFYTLSGMAQFLPQKKPKPPRRYINKPSPTENNASGTKFNQGLSYLLDMGTTITFPTSS